MPDEQLLEKLRKIKALAEEAKDDHECQAAMLLFQRLLDKNGLVTADVECGAPAEAGPETCEVFTCPRIEKWLHHLHCTIASHFRCLPVTAWRPGRGSCRLQTLQFVGHKQDAMIAAQAFQTAQRAAEHLYSAYRLRQLQEDALSFGFGVPEQGGRATIHRGRYLLGFALGMEAAFRKQEAETTFDLTLPYTKVLALLDVPTEQREAAAAEVDANNRSAAAIRKALADRDRERERCEREEAERRNAEAERDRYRKAAEEAGRQAEAAASARDRASQLSMQYNEKLTEVQAELTALKNRPLPTIATTVAPDDYEEYKAKAAQAEAYRRRAEEAETYAIQQEAAAKQAQAAARRAQAEQIEHSAEMDSAPYSAQKLGEAVRAFMAAILRKNDPNSQSIADLKGKDDLK